MKQILKHGWIGILMLLPTSVVHGHLAVEHSMDFKTGFIHLLTDPVHVSIIVVFVVLPLLFAFRKRIGQFVDWMAGNVFRR